MKTQVIITTISQIVIPLLSILAVIVTTLLSNRKDSHLKKLDYTNGDLMAFFDISQAFRRNPDVVMSAENLLTLKQCRTSFRIIRDQKLQDSMALIEVNFEKLIELGINFPALDDLKSDISNETVMLSHYNQVQEREVVDKKFRDFYKENFTEEYSTLLKSSIDVEKRLDKWIQKT